MTRTEFNILVAETGRRLYEYAYRILRSREGSEDAVQEVFVKLWKMNPRLNEYKSIEALALTMVKNYCIDQLRKQKFIEPADSSSFPQYSDAEPTPHDRLENSETSAILSRIIRELPEIYRSIIQLRDIDELPYEEISEITGQNINTLRVNLSRARKLVRDEYKKYTDGYGRNKTTA
jgi:RNA polymerase sigma factor (sigma-70 family)